MQRFTKAVIGKLLLVFGVFLLISHVLVGNTDLRVFSFEIMFFGKPACEGSTNGSIDLTIIGGTPPFIYDWSGSLPDTKNQANLAPGNYEVTVTDALGATSVRPIVIGESIIDFDPEVFASCGANNGSIQLNAFGGTAPYDAQWSDPSLTGLDPAQIDQGTYAVTVTDANGCTANTSVTVGDFPPFEISVSSDANTITIGDQTPFEINVNGGVLPYQVTWSPPVGIENMGALNSYIGPSASTQYTVMVIDGNGCLATDELTIIVANPYNAVLGPDTTICQDSIRLTGNLPFDAYGLWEGPPGVTIQQPDEATTLFTNLKEGKNEFRWTIKSFNNLYYDFDDIVIYVEPRTRARNDKYFTNNYTALQNMKLLDNDRGFRLESLSFELLSEPSFGRLIEADELGKYHFVPDPEFIGVDSFRYEVCNTSCNQCETALVSLKIEAVDDICDIFPTGITPNGDGLNDVLFFDQLDKFPDKHLVVFNRWGTVVYEARPYQNDWRGTTRSGKPLTAGTYFYHLRLDLSNGIICSKELTILR